MGMFDYFKCEYKLTDNCKETEFQTKDLECQMNRYTLDEHGFLWEEQKIGRNLTRNHHTGWVNFYIHTGHPFSENYKSWGFNAEFFRGDMREISGGLLESGIQWKDLSELKYSHWLRTDADELMQILNNDGTITELPFKDLKGDTSKIKGWCPFERKILTKSHAPC